MGKFEIFRFLNVHKYHKKTHTDSKYQSNVRKETHIRKFESYRYLNYLKYTSIDKKTHTDSRSWFKTQSIKVTSKKGHIYSEI